MVNDEFSPFKRHSGWFSQNACYPMHDAHPGVLEDLLERREGQGLGRESDAVDVRRTVERRRPRDVADPSPYAVTVCCLRARRPAASG